MNIRKVGRYNTDTRKIDIIAHYPYNRSFNYIGRGKVNRIKRVGLSRMIKGYPNITQHVKRNRTHKIVLTPTNLNEAE